MECSRYTTAIARTTCLLVRTKTCLYVTPEVQPSAKDDVTMLKPNNVVIDVDGSTQAFFSYPSSSNHYCENTRRAYSKGIYGRVGRYLRQFHASWYRTRISLRLARCSIQCSQQPALWSHEEWNKLVHVVDFFFASSKPNLDSQEMETWTLCCIDFWWCSLVSPTRHLPWRKTSFRIHGCGLLPEGWQTASRQRPTSPVRAWRRQKRQSTTTPWRC